MPHWHRLKSMTKDPPVTEEFQEFEDPCATTWDKDKISYYCSSGRKGRWLTVQEGVVAAQEEPEAEMNQGVGVAS